VRAAEGRRERRAAAERVHDDAALRGAYLRDVEYDEWTVWPESVRDVLCVWQGDKYLNYADLIFANLSGADLTGARLTNAKLSAADLTGADLRDAITEGTDFRGALGR
jgi:uncharacterized protein YjbI with pentapeptide repeats